MANVKLKTASSNAHRWRCVFPAVFLLVIIFAPRLSNAEDDDDADGDAWADWGKGGAGRPSRKYDARVDPSTSTKRPVYAYIKLSFNPHRKIEEVREISKRWTDLLKTGSVKSRFFPVDPNTLFITIDDESEIMSVKDFALSQEHAYEFMVGDKVFRRNGDPPLEQVAGVDEWTKEMEAKREIKTQSEEKLIKKQKKKKKRKTESQKHENDEL